MFTPELKTAVEDFLGECRKKGLKVTAAESCTGGLICGLFTEVPGVSSMFERGFVTYSNESKTELLGVDAKLIKEVGAVSDQVAAAMAEGAMKRANADIAVAVTGIAGPDGGTPQKPVGLVYIAVATKDGIVVENNHFKGDRNNIRQMTLMKAMQMLQDSVGRIYAVA